MLPEPPEIIECPRCLRCHFLVDLRVVDADQATIERIPEVIEPSETAYYRAIAAGLARDRDEERLLRVRAWWRSNDVHRGGREGAIADQPAGDRNDREANLTSLMTLLNDEEEADVVLKAEILRELARWNEAEAVLARIESHEHAPIVQRLLTLCAERSQAVQLAPPVRGSRTIVIRL